MGGHQGSGGLERKSVHVSGEGLSPGRASTSLEGIPAPEQANALAPTGCLT